MAVRNWAASPSSAASPADPHWRGLHAQPGAVPGDAPMHVTPTNRGEAASNARGALDDWMRALRSPALWANLALEDLRDRYRRTVLGVAWIAISFALFVAVK